MRPRRIGIGPVRIRRVRFPESSDPLPGIGLSEGVQAGHENNGKCPQGTTRGDYPLGKVLTGGAR